MKEIISIEQQNLLPEKLFVENGTDDILRQIEDEALSFVPDPTTPVGRKQIASMAHKVARSKTYLDGLGKDLVSGIKKQAIVIDAERRKVRGRLDTLKVKVREPLTAFEEIEEQRIAALKVRVEAIHTELPEGTHALREHLAELEGIAIDESWQEFAGNAALEKERAVSECKDELAKSVKRDEEEAAAAAAAKKAQEEREERIRAQAKAEEKARAEEVALAAERAKQEEIDRIKREAEEAKAAAEKAAEQERLRLIAEQEAKIAAEKQAHQDAIRAEQEKARNEAERVAKETARKIEEKRLADEEREQKEREAKEEQERKAANQNHRRSVNRQALADLMEHAGVPEEQGKIIIKAIAAGEIAHVSLRY